MVQIRDFSIMDRMKAQIIGRCRYVLTLDPDSDYFLEACSWLYMCTGVLLGADASSLQRNIRKKRKKAKTAYTFRTSIYVGNRIGLGFRYRISSTGRMNDEQIKAYYN